MMRNRFALLLAPGVVGLLIPAPMPAADINLAQGMIAGEVTATSVILQTRLTAVPAPRDGAVPGATGVARFAVADNPGFRDAQLTDWLEAREAADFIVRKKITGLRPGTRYHYRAEFGATRVEARPGPAASLRTLPGPAASARVSFVASSCMNYVAFHLGRGGSGGGYQGPDKPLGYPALPHILGLAPDFWIGNGDNVYYDHIKSAPARTPAQMRAKWHEQFAMPRLRELLAQVPACFLKDDHEYRYDDADSTPGREPSHDLGIRIFREQVPIVDPADPGAVTYRTVRAGRHLQVWFLEGRDFRSANEMPDGPGKSIWGRVQLAWLKRTLRESDATYRIIVSPSPLIGPDNSRKHDNHADIGGFQHEGGEFFAWLAGEGFDRERLFIVCGDRHWKYHSRHPTGYEEFGTGALNTENAIVGTRFAPGLPTSSDPEGRMRRFFADDVARGGFLGVVVTPDVRLEAPVELAFTLYDDHGRPLYAVTKSTRSDARR